MASAPVLLGAEALGIDTAALKPGFADPVHDAQAVFRVLLSAMARPGIARTVPQELDAPAPLDSATAALALTLFDNDTPVWIDWIADTPPLRDFLRFHCGCPLSERSQAAAFALVTDPTNMPRLALLAQGIDQYPDRSATLLLQLPDLESGPPVQLRGPGIRESETIRPAGLPDWFWNDWRLNTAQFPLGVDIFLTSGRTVIGLPRSIVTED